MNRKYLEDLGLEKETIDKIMSEHGKTIEEQKTTIATLTTERDTAKTQLTDANKTIEGFADYEDTKKAADEYKKKFEDSEKDFNSKLDEMSLNKSIEDIAKENKVKSLKAFIPFLDLESLKKSTDRAKDIKAQFDKVKADENNKFLFDSGEPIDNPVLPTGGKNPPIDARTSSMMKAMGLKEEKE